MARRTSNNGSSATVEQPQPEVEKVEQPQPEQAQPEQLDLAALVAAEEVEKAQRIYTDVAGVPRPPTPDGTLAAVQREQRADGTEGEFLLCEIRKSKTKGQPDSVQRYSLARLQALKSALEAAGVVLFN